MYWRRVRNGANLSEQLAEIFFPPPLSLWHTAASIKTSTFLCLLLFLHTVTEEKVGMPLATKG